MEGSEQLEQTNVPNIKIYIQKEDTVINKSTNPKMCKILILHWNIMKYK